MIIVGADDAVVGAFVRRAPHDQRREDRLQCLDRLIVDALPQQDDALRALKGDRILAGHGRQQQRITVRRQGLRDAAKDLQRIGIGHHPVGRRVHLDNDTDRMRTLEFQIARGLIDAIAVFLGQGEDAVARFRIDGKAAAQRARYRDLRHAGQLGQFIHGDVGTRHTYSLSVTRLCRAPPALSNQGLRAEPPAQHDQADPQQDHRYQGQAEGVVAAEMAEHLTGDE